VSDEDGYLYNGLLAVNMFIVLGIAIFLTGIGMVCTLRKHFKRFYTDFRCYLFAATILLSFPLFIRATWDFL